MAVPGRVRRCFPNFLEQAGIFGNLLHPLLGKDLFQVSGKRDRDRLRLCREVGEDRNSPHTQTNRLNTLRCSLFEPVRKKLAPSLFVGQSLTWLENTSPYPFKPCRSIMRTSSRCRTSPIFGPDHARMG